MSIEQRGNDENFNIHNQVIYIYHRPLNELIHEATTLLRGIIYDDLEYNREYTASYLMGIAGMVIGAEPEEITSYLKDVYDLDSQDRPYSIAIRDKKMIETRSGVVKSMVEASKNHKAVFSQQAIFALRNHLDGDRNYKTEPVFMHLAAAGLSVVPIRDDQSVGVIIRLDEDLFER